MLNFEKGKTIVWLHVTHQSTLNTHDIHIPIMKDNPPLSKKHRSKSTLQLDRFPGGWCHRDRNE